MNQERIATEHPDPDKRGEHILAWKYQAVRDAILTAVPADEPGLAFAELPAAVRAALPEAQLAELGSVRWYVTVVKLDLEARGALRRLPGRGPQRLIRG